MFRTLLSMTDDPNDFGSVNAIRYWLARCRQYIPGHFEFVIPPHLRAKCKKLQIHGHAPQNLHEGQLIPDQRILAACLGTEALVNPPNKNMKSYTIHRPDAACTCSTKGLQLLHYTTQDLEQVAPSTLYHYASCPKNAWFALFRRHF